MKNYLQLLAIIILDLIAQKPQEGGKVGRQTWRGGEVQLARFIFLWPVL